MQRGFTPYQHGSVTSHYYGAAAEIAVAKHLGIQVDPNWTWEGDQARGGDLIHDGHVIHVRSSRNGERFLWRTGKDSREGKWIFCDTSRYPEITITGWLPGYQAYLLTHDGYINRQDLKTLPIKMRISLWLAELRVSNGNHQVVR